MFCKLECSQSGLANQKLCYIPMFVNKEKSEEKDKERLVSRDPGLLRYNLSKATSHPNIVSEFAKEFRKDLWECYMVNKTL